MEANIKPPALQDGWLKTEKERVFKKVWDSFIKEDAPSQGHYQTLDRPILITSIQKAISRLCKEPDIQINGDIHIVLHGFYFVTPEQQIILENLRKTQIRITFFHYFDGRYTNTFNFIKAFVTDRFGWPSPEEWIYDSATPEDTTKSARTFLSAYENKPNKPEELAEAITGYASFLIFYMM